MSRQVAIGRIEQVASGQPTRFEVAGVGAIAVYYVGDRCYATSDECTHGMASLGTDGALDGFTIECGWHGGKFDVRTGAVLGPPCTLPLKVYPVSVEDSTLLITVDGT
jgi:nitrite reductase/ring-hydroxylating ferredoxin subunit